MKTTQNHRRFNILALSVLGACVAGLYGAALPGVIGTFGSSAVGGELASKVGGTLPEAAAEAAEDYAVVVNPSWAARTLEARTQESRTPERQAASDPAPRPLDAAAVQALRTAAQQQRPSVSASVEPPVATMPGALDVRAVEALYADLGYALDDVRDTASPVPRVYLTAVPQGIQDIYNVEDRKSLFLRTVLPLVLKVNEELAADRDRLLRLQDSQKAGAVLSYQDRRWLDEQAQRYGLESPVISTLLRHVDTVPPSLALAQAIEESGWGTSRFARQGNALFGQWTTGDGLIPANRREGRDHAIRAFPTLLDAVRGYAYNLNSHRAYRDFRSQRAQMRAQGQDLDGATLAGTLLRYSERGEHYVETIRALMRQNALSQFDTARLGETSVDLATR